MKCKRRATCFNQLRLSAVILLTAPWAMQAQRCGANAASTIAATPIATDRPQITSSSVVVPCGSLQLENGLEMTGTAGRLGVDLPETAMRLGIAGKTELRLAVPDYFYNVNTTFGPTSGAGDIVVGLKQQLGPLRGFDFSVVPALGLPTGAQAISSHGYDPSVQVPWSHALSKNWTAAGMFSLMWPTEITQSVPVLATQRNLTGQASAYFDRQITAPCDAYFEYSDAFAERGGPQHQIGFGAAYKPTPHQQLDVHFGVGFAAAAPAYTVGVGYSVRFQVFGRR